MKKSTSIILYTILSICVVLASYVIIGISVFYRPISVPKYEYSKTELETYADMLNDQYDVHLCRLTKDEYKYLLDLDLGATYMYSEKPMRMAGVTHPLIRLISMDNDLDDMEYCTALTHEMHHLLLFSGNERYVCQETFKYLLAKRNILITPFIK